METAVQDIPPYVDTETKPVKWYAYNSFIFVASLAMVYIASLILEFELAKLRNPMAGFIPTPTWADIILSTIVILLGFANLSVLLFVIMRHLWLRKWMMVTTLIGWMLLAVLALALQWRFLAVLIPTFRP